MIWPLVGRRLGGATITPWNDHESVHGSLGRPVWGPRDLLADLEVRLGLPRLESPPTLREQVWASALASCAGRGRFYTRSFEADRLGTAATLLAWRDALVEAGWDGAIVDGGGARLDALAEVESAVRHMPASASDRLRAVVESLTRRASKLLDGLTLAESEWLWPGRWRALFAHLARAGTQVETLAAPPSQPAPPSTDLGRLQGSVRGEAPSSAAAGDGSLMAIRAGTSLELAEALAAWMRAQGSPSVVVIRAGEPQLLDSALACQGFPPLGALAASAHRPALQVLPLAIELAFEPRDPHRLLELLTLPSGPFQGRVGWDLARVVVKSPGIGGPGWKSAVDWLKAHLAELTNDPKGAARRLARIAEWLERPGSPRSEGAPRAALLDVVVRVEDWLRGRLASARDDSILRSAFAQARELRVALAAEGREVLSLVEARALLDRVTSAGLVTRLAEARAGKLDHVDEPGALIGSRETVVFWHAVAGTESVLRLPPLTEAELGALRRAGVDFPAVDDILADEVASWRRAILGARRRLVFAIPETAAGRRLSPHPLWDEVVARLEMDEAIMERCTLTPRRLRAGRVPVEVIVAPALPAAHARWRLPSGIVPPGTKHSATSLEALLGCPLRWVLERGAALRSGAVAALPRDHVIAGNLGHRLVQRLHEEGLLGHDPDALGSRAGAILEELIVQEGATWLMPGRAFDREQWSGLLRRAAVALSRGLKASGLQPMRVEEEVTLAWEHREIRGRIDLLSETAAGRPVVIDLKWGAKSYRQRLEQGAALQLAVYARAAGASSAAYFALKAGRFLSVEPGLIEGERPIDGPSIPTTWERVERTTAAVEAALAAGDVAVTGVALSTGLHDSLGIAEADRGAHFVVAEGPCRYCGLGPICGRSWERMR